MSIYPKDNRLSFSKDGMLSLIILCLNNVSINLFSFDDLFYPVLVVSITGCYLRFYVGVLLMSLAMCPLSTSRVSITLPESVVSF